MTTKYEFHSPSSLLAVGNRLPTAGEKDVYWREESDGPVDQLEVVEDYKAVYNPDNGDMYGIVTDDYQIINPPEFLGPLASELKERDRTDIEGIVLVHGGGGYGYGEILFDTHSIWPPDRNRSEDPVRCGMTFRYSHDGGISVRASGFAQDGICKNTMRRVTDAVYVKHAGDVGDRVDWRDEWSKVLDQLGAFSERLAEVIEDAFIYELFGFSNHEWPDGWLDVTSPQQAFEDVPTPPTVEREHVRGLHGFYDYLGFPNYLCLSATDRLVYRMSMADDPRIVTAWDAYAAITYALSHQARFEAGSSSDDDYHRVASDILTNPAKALEDAERGLMSEMQVEEEDGLFGIESTVGEAIQEYEQREEDLRSALGE